MKTLEQLTGPWTGFSIQDGIRIMERLHLTIGGGKIEGEGSDMDGNFVVQGAYSQDQVHVVRRYREVRDRGTGAYRADPHAVRMLYDYLGKWDGALLFGQWASQEFPFEMNGPFEWWPDREEDRKELEIALEERQLALPGAR
jgi:hypothetical protein